MAENLTGTIINSPQPQDSVQQADIRQAAPVTAGKKRGKGLLIGILLLVLAIAGGVAYILQGSFMTDPNAPVTLTYWGLWDSAQVMQPLIDGYKKVHPNVTIKYEQRPIENHYDTVKSRLAVGGGEVPDIVRVHSSWVPVLQNELAPLPSTVMSNSEYAKAFYPVTKTDLLLGGKYYGIPLQIDGLVLAYNQDLFSHAGLASAPQTWEAVREDAARLTQKDANSKIVVAGIAMGETSNVDNFADIVGLLMAQNGVQVTDSKGAVVFDKAVTGDGRNLGVEALSFYRLFSTTETDWDSSMESSSVAFSKGKVAMILTSAQQLATIVSQNPQLNYRVAPVPQLASDEHVGYASYWVETVAKRSAHQQQAWDFLKYLSGKEQEMALAQQEEKVLPFAMPPSRIDLASAFTTDPVLGAFVTQQPTYQTSFFTNAAKAPNYNGAIADSLAQALQHIDGGSTGSGGDGVQAITDLAKSVTQIVQNQEK